MLDNRKKRVLQAIVEEYINSAEPVSSGALVKKHNLQYSSATIRNDMAELEQIGLLDKPHTSAGRIPSSKGYRFYVDELLQPDNISKAEINFIQSKLQKRVNELEELTKNITNTLAEVTHYTSLAVGPKNDTHNIEDIKFVLLGNNILMAVVLTDAGIIKETIIKLEEEISYEQVESLNQIFNARLRGKPLEKINQPLEQYIISEMNFQLNIIKSVVDQLNSELEKKQDIYLEGTNNVFNFPEFKQIESAKNFLQLLDTKDVIENLLQNGISEDVNVYIGTQNEEDTLKNLSLVTFKHTLNGKDLGTIGIIGPTRMDYSKVISIMKYISRYLNGMT